MLQFLPVDVEPGPAAAVEGIPVDEAKIAATLATAPLGITEDESFSSPYFRIYHLRATRPTPRGGVPAV